VNGSDSPALSKCFVVALGHAGCAVALTDATSLRCLEPERELGEAAAPHGEREAMINGAHVIVYSKDADVDRAFFRDVLKFPYVDAGHGWLIFGMPTSEVACHPGDNDQQELYLMCEDVKAFVAAMKKRKVKCEPITEARWGSITRVELPGGGHVGVYQPKHKRP
jgi:hypothetical protein